MRNFFLSIMHSWGSDTPPEVIWSLNDLLEWAKSKGFNPSENVSFSEDNDSDYETNELLVKELSDWFENLK